MVQYKSQVHGIEYSGMDLDANGFNNPHPFVSNGRLFGWLGSVGRGANLVASIYVLEELITLAAAATSTSANTSLLPTNSLILVTLGRVTVTTTTTATFGVGDAGLATRFATAVAIAANTTFLGWNHLNPTVVTDAPGWRQTANAGVRITPNATPGNANGRIAVQVLPETFLVPTA